MMDVALEGLLLQQGNRINIASLSLFVSFEKEGALIREESVIVLVRST